MSVKNGSGQFDAIEQRGINGGLITGLSTGFPTLDFYLSGLQPGNLYLLAARPAVGKSAGATSITANICRAGYTVQFFSLEMSGAQVAQRILTAESRVDSHSVRIGQLAKEDWGKLLSGTQRLYEGYCLVDDSTSLTPAMMRAVCRRTQAEYGLDLVVVDYLQLMAGGADGGRGENRNIEVSEISRALKLLAREFHVPVLVLSQLSRNVERREDKRPLLSDLRDSGSLEQDADCVMFLHRDSYQNDAESNGMELSNPYQPDPTELIIRKQRMGPTGTVKLNFIRAFSRFEDATHIQESAAE